MIRVELISKLKIVNGAFLFTVPASFFPDYTKHGLSKEEAGYDFKLTGKIATKTMIMFLSTPANTETTKESDGCVVSFTNMQPERRLDFYFRTFDMMAMNLVYAESPSHPGEVAC